MPYRKSQFPYFSLRTNKEVLLKIGYLAALHDRSINKEIEQILVRYISSWNENTAISDEDDIFLKTTLPPARTAIRIAPEILKPLKDSAQYNGRSTNKEIEQILLRYIRDCEIKKGVIPLNP